MRLARHHTAHSHARTLALEFLFSAQYLDTVAPVLDTLPGVVTAEFFDDVAVARVHYYRATIGPRDIVKVIDNAKVACEVAPDGLVGAGEEDAMTKERRVWSRLLFMGLVLTIPAVLIAMVIPMMSEDAMHALEKEVVPGLTIQVLILFILVTPVQFVLGRRFYVGAYNALK